MGIFCERINFWKEKVRPSKWSPQNIFFLIRTVANIHMTHKSVLLQDTVYDILGYVAFEQETCDPNCGIIFHITPWCSHASHKLLKNWIFTFQLFLVERQRNEYITSYLWLPMTTRLERIGSVSVPSYHTEKYMMIFQNSEKSMIFQNIPRHLQ
jgi:hypothetical protein